MKNYIHDYADKKDPDGNLGNGYYKYCGFKVPYNIDPNNIAKGSFNGYFLKEFQGRSTIPCDKRGVPLRTVYNASGRATGRYPEDLTPPKEMTQADRASHEPSCSNPLYYNREY
jgi:hypothetical protein